MLTIFANSFLTATRQKKWDAPDHWHENEHPPRSERANRIAEQQKMRRWLAETGVM
ncbi:MAG: hypothetical protein AAGA70_04310 [Pseudomonadota bacterium]